jgi:hypothetical protein
MESVIGWVITTINTLGISGLSNNFQVYLPEAKFFSAGMAVKVLFLVVSSDQ